MKNSGFRKIYQRVGQFAYPVILPFLRLMIKNTRRHYAVIQFHNQVMLVQDWLGRQDWRLPGGGAKFNEDPRSTVARELEEELGITIRAPDLKLLTSGVWESDRLGYSYSIYMLSSPKKLIGSPRPLEIINAVWFDIDKVSQLPICPEISEAISKLPR
jgi:8-oxo-dGTP pyrophosphatase MutT (NUDIX family)